MLDFLMISTRPGKRGSIEIYPRFIIGKSSDLMIRGGDFYAFWLEDEKRWSTVENDLFKAIDKELDNYYAENKNRLEGFVKVLHMWDAETGMVDVWHRYCQKQLRDSYHMLDEKLVFSNMEPSKKDYASKRLNYPLEPGETPAYDKLMDTLYDPEEREKIEWSVGSIVSGDSRKLQKFLVLYGDSGTGKSTVLNIIQQLFDGYYSVFDAKSLGSANNQFALEAFSSNPLVAIQHDGDLSKIEDNTRLNSLVSHEAMVVNEKHKNLYKNSFKSFLFMGTNKPVKITDSKSGIIRRLIDVSPSGRLLSRSEYKTVTKLIGFELGGIAWHCKEVYESDPGKYDDYVPTAMLGASNDFYNFIMDSYVNFEESDGITLKAAWELYKNYCEYAKVYFPLSQRLFKEELKTYFDKFEDRAYIDGARIRNYYSGFKTDKFETKKISGAKSEEHSWLEFLDGSVVYRSAFDLACSTFPAQYASDGGTPAQPWSKVNTTLANIDTHKLHFVRFPDGEKNHIVIDFDIPDENGNKCLEKNIEEASKWPPTYAEVSKSGAGLHLHYIYVGGDASNLKRVYGDHIEIKVFTGNASLRRMLTKCNCLPIATISSGLPLQEEKKDGTVKIKSQKKLIEMIERNLNKEFHGATKPSCDFIYKIVEDAYNDGVNYEIPADLREKIMNFAKNSTHHGKECVALMKKMHFMSKEKEMQEKYKTNGYNARVFISKTVKSDGNIRDKFDSINEYLLNLYNSGELFDVTDLKGSLLYLASSQKVDNNAQYCLSVLNNMVFRSDDNIESEEKDRDRQIIFYDLEVYPNLLLVCWKAEGPLAPVIRWFNPSPEQIEELLEFRLIGFNCRRYDNHILHARLMGWSNEKIYRLSQKIVNGGREAFFGDAYNYSYTDVYDFASASNKMSLKKLEIRMGIHHQEMGIPWDKPVEEKLWPLIGDYCENDVKATEAAFNFLRSDWAAREILAAITELTVNDTTNAHTTKLMFNGNKHPQDQFHWRDLSKPVYEIPDDMMLFLSEACPDMMSMTHGEAHSLLPYFPGYHIEGGKSIYRGEEVGEGGYVYAEPGIYFNVALLDIASMHPHSTIAECLFGVAYTTTYRELVLARVYIKHEQWSKAEKILGGKLKPFIQMIKDGKISGKDLSTALKTAINSVYGLTTASFENAFKDPRNIDNIVAKRGALFMVDLKHAVQERGFTVAHIKTDSIKIPNATPEIIQFVMDFGKMYGYTFEHEATYEKMCLVNDAVYIAKYADGEHEFELPTGEKVMTAWTATGTQFQVPYVFKTLFAKLDYKFDDFCETKSVKSAIYLDMNEGSPIEDGHNYQFVGKVGQFCPVIDGAGGGILYREQNEKYYAITGTKGYRWLESEVVRNMSDGYSVINMTYYDKLVDEAMATISKYGDPLEFAELKEELEIVKEKEITKC